MPNLDKEIDRLSQKSGKTVEEIRKDLDELHAQGYDDEAAIVVWQSENSLAMQGETIPKAIFRVLHKTDVRDWEKNGNEGQISNFMAFVLNPENNSKRLCTFNNWNDYAQVVDSLDVGGLYECNVKVKSEGDICLAGLTDTPNPVDDNGQLAQNPELLKEYDPDPISKAGDSIEEEGLYTAIVGSDVKETDYGYVFNASSIGGDPVGIFTDVEPGVRKGDRVAIYGYVYHPNKQKVGKRGGLQISRAQVFQI